MAVSDYSTTPASNTSISGINIAEGCSPANINNAIRQLMADVKGFYNTPIAGLTASAAELNILDGVTASTAELNILDGVTATAAEINVLDGITASTAELNVLDGIPPTLTATEIGYLDGVTSSIQNQINALSSGGNATHTIWLPAGSFNPTTTNGATYAIQELATNDVMVAGYDFSASTDQKVQTMIAMPKSWNESTVTAQILWKDASSAGSGNVIWGVRARAVGDDDAMDAAFGTAQTVTDTFIASGDLHITSTTAAITAAGTPAEGDLLIVEVYRDADAGGDTYTQSARFIGLRLLYTTNAADDS
jgi:hypothetical protein